MPIVTAKYADALNGPDDYIGGQMELHEIIKENVRTLLKDSSFHMYGRDDEVRFHFDANLQTNLYHSARAE